MANGDAAAAAGLDLVAPTDPRAMGYDEDNKTRDYMALIPVARGGTGATTPAAARTNLGIMKTSAATPNSLVERDDNGRASIVSPTSSSHIANKFYVDSTAKAEVEAGVLPVSLELKEAQRIIARLSAEIESIKARLP